MTSSFLLFIVVTTYEGFEFAILRGQKRTPSILSLAASQLTQCRCSIAIDRKERHFEANLNTWPWFCLSAPRVGKLRTEFGASVACRRSAS